MNSLSKLQVLMTGFLLLMVAAFILELALVVPASILFLFQFQIARGELRKDYPEDWLKYVTLFLVYEMLLVLVFFIVATTPVSYMDLTAIYNIFMLLIFVIILTLAMRYLIVRNFCYGNILFSTEGWVGVHLNSGMFSKVNEADYAVKNPLKLKVRKGDRVRVHVHRGMGRSVPTELTEITK